VVERVHYGNEYNDFLDKWWALRFGIIQAMQGKEIHFETVYEIDKDYRLQEPCWYNTQTLMDFSQEDL